MPKFYVIDPAINTTIIIANDPLDACIKAIQHRFNCFITSTNDCYYLVSERGFDAHDGDWAITPNDILEELQNRG